jgi:hypothetical protein
MKAMAELKLARLPDRKPVKIGITVNPGLNQRLEDYARAYKEAYGDEERVADLIPYILDQFLAGDRRFNSKRRQPMARS